MPASFTTDAVAAADMKTSITWSLIPGTPDYRSHCGRYRAVYKSTHRSGFAGYWVFKSDTPRRRQTMSNALSVGGLPPLL